MGHAKLCQFCSKMQFLLALDDVHLMNVKEVMCFFGQNMGCIYEIPVEINGCKHYCFTGLGTYEPVNLEKISAFSLAKILFL